ncbi:GPW/gp25 family protein [Streptomyces afghaniensis]|uniref:GPW/gp25 family protein n=1 Tax=Streptomyces TaxID=1883 RepID=UPI001FAEFE37|nr:GPW/gp25 family protein [Streptomyces sp. HP-A2021]UOB15374.1 GPW/gp25 family protein [Streptomyces sp. HP-A2021]
MESEFHGRGLAHPVRWGNAGLAESAGRRKIQESIRIILGTQHGERLMRPDYGCNLKRLMFAPNNESTASLARYYVEEGLSRWEPRIELLDVTVHNDTGSSALLIDIRYRLRATGAADRFVHFFPLEQSP